MIEHQKHLHAGYKRKFISLIWIVPLMTLLAVGFLAWKGWHNQGQDITIRFEKVDGVEADRTQIRHNGVVLGTVTALTPADNFAHVEIRARMSNVATPYLRANTKFWVVHPRVSGGSISGLNTLVSGAYIEMQPGDGDTATAFTSKDEPLVAYTNEPGQLFLLKTEQLASIEVESPIYYHGIKVGEVASYDLDEDMKNVILKVFIHAPYDKLVHQGTCFWNVSGVNLTVGSSGIQLGAQSLQSILAGGVAFDVPPGGHEGGAPANDTPFKLYHNNNEADASIYTRQITYQMVFHNSVQGLTVGMPVTLMGSPVGSITKLSITTDAQNGTISAHVTATVQPERFDMTGLNTTQSIEAQGREAIDSLIRKGLRARISNSSLLTGQKNIDLDFVPDAKPVSVAEGQIPTAPTADLNSLLQSSNELVDSLHTTSQSLDQMFKDADNGDSSSNVAGTLHELKEAARSIRVLADYLDAHPESILLGKKKSNDESPTP